MCSKRNAWPTIAEAMRGLEEMVARFQRDRSPRGFMRIYQCEQCGLYHATHKPRRIYTRPKPKPKGVDACSS